MPRIVHAGRAQHLVRFAHDRIIDRPSINRSRSCAACSTGVPNRSVLMARRVSTSESFSPQNYVIMAKRRPVDRCGRSRPRLASKGSLPPGLPIGKSSPFESSVGERWHLFAKAVDGGNVIVGEPDSEIACTLEGKPSHDGSRFHTKAARPGPRAVPIIQTGFELKYDGYRAPSNSSDIVQYPEIPSGLKSECLRCRPADGIFTARAEVSDVRRVDTDRAAFELDLRCENPLGPRNVEVLKLTAPRCPPVSRR
jgi:hypothetical protein